MEGSVGTVGGQWNKISLEFLGQLNKVVCLFSSIIS